jgi:hypothetical protein
MTFIPATNITSANPGPALYAVLEPVLLALGYEFVKTVVIGATTHKVLKSPAAGNSMGLDWYLDVNYPTTGVTGGFRMAPFEYFNPANDTAVRGPVGHQSSTQFDTATFSRYGAGAHALETNWTNSASVTAISMVLSTATFTIWANVTRDSVTLLSTSDASAMLHTGFFEPTPEHAAHAGADLYPLVMTRFFNGIASSGTSTSNATAAITRAPRAAGINWALSVWAGPTSAQLGGILGTGVSDFTGKISLPRLNVVMGTNSPSYSSTPAAHVGYLRDLAAGFAAPSTVRGDSVEIEGGGSYVSSALTFGSVVILMEAA